VVVSNRIHKTRSLMTERAALIAAVCQHPHDDTPRLIFADWCEEHGEPDRAAFIRAQIELSRIEGLRCAVDGTLCDGYEKWRKRCRCAACKLRRTECEASKRRINWDWCGGVDGGWAWMIQRDAWRRGFAELAVCKAAEWLAKADAILAAHPIRRVTLTTWPVEVPDFPPVWWEGANGLEEPLVHELTPGRCDRWPGINFVVQLELDFQGSHIVGPGWQNRLVPREQWT